MRLRVTVVFFGMAVVLFVVLDWLSPSAFSRNHVMVFSGFARQLAQTMRTSSTATACGKPRSEHQGLHVCMHKVDQPPFWRAARERRRHMASGAPSHGIRGAVTWHQGRRHMTP